MTELVSHFTSEMSGSFFSDSMNQMWRKLSLKMDRVAQRIDRADFKARLEEFYPPKQYSEFYQALSAENNFIRQTYLQAFKETGIVPLVDGIVGSLSYGMATITHGSDVDGVVITIDDFTKEQSKNFDQYLQNQGIPSNVRIFSVSDLKKIQDQHVKVAMLMQLYEGVSIAGDPSLITSVATNILNTIPRYQFYDARQDWIGGLQEQAPTPTNKYLQRAKNYHRALQSFNTAYYNRPELFADPRLVQIANEAKSRGLNTSKPFAKDIYEAALGITSEAIFASRSGDMLLDLGAGVDTTDMARFANEKMRTSLYVAVDKYHLPDLGPYANQPGCFRAIKQDALLYLSMLPSNLACVTTNGFDELILMNDTEPASRVYVKELLGQIARVTAIGGLVFGLGSPFLRALPQYGFVLIDGTTDYCLFQKQKP